MLSQSLYASFYCSYTLPQMKRKQNWKGAFHATYALPCWQTAAYNMQDLFLSLQVPIASNG